MRYLILTLVIANLAFYFFYPEAEPEAVPPVPASAEREALVLLSERPAFVRIDPEPNPEELAYLPPDATIIPANATIKKPEPLPPRRCSTVGPFFGPDSAAAAALVLQQHGYLPQTRSSKLQVPAGYQVSLPAMPADQARSIVAHLDAEGMTDYYIGKGHAISLGIFSKKEFAARRLEQVTELGYPARLDQRYRAREAFWLELEEKGQPLQSRLFWASLQETYPRLDIQQVSCE